MNREVVDRIANAVLYEGYILYPYRASSQKNHSRWQWGVVMAPGYAAADPSESSFTQAECVLEHTGQPVVQVILRFALPTKNCPAFPPPVAFASPLLASRSM